MAKFEMEDGTVISSGHYMDKLDSNNSSHTYKSIFSSKLDIEKLKIPSGKDNRHRLGNLCTYDLLIHIQETLSLNNRCIIYLITNEEHKCPVTNDIIRRKIHQFAEKFITNELRETYPRQKIRYKIKDDEFDYRFETDEEWMDRLCHLIMHKDHPYKLHMIQCEECLQTWLNSSKW